MTVQHFGTGAGLLAQIREGMEVYDRGNTKLGTVKDVYLGGEDLSEATVPEGSTLAAAPPALRSRLAAHGFLEIGTGLLQANRYATGDQVAAVGEDRVTLAVAQDELLKK
ncbi:MAG TPA: PRC-barrel domain-containing protein [Thermomicrobiales bacterium]|nr:PRC-barrel domain-containing protein [Thermomicrobiales bacterium]